MRKALFITLAVLLCSFYAVAQDYPKAEVFGGFSMVHLDTENAESLLAGTGVSVKRWYPGWEAAPQFNLTKMLGVKADFSGHYGVPVSGGPLAGVPVPSLHLYNILFGPVISFRGDRLTPFVHAGFGLNHASVTSTAVFTCAGRSCSDNAFAMAFGGGLDVKLTRHFAARLGQFDYVYTKHDICAIISAPAAPTPACEAATPPHQNNFHFSTGIVIH